VSSIDVLREKWQKQLRVRVQEMIGRVDWPRVRLDAHRRDALRAVLARAVAKSA
jgi:hypothetical protein